MEEERQQDVLLGMTVNRINALTDGIFAFAMTLLVLSIEIPTTEFSSSKSLHLFIFGQIHDLFNFVLSFILLASFWIIHHQQYHYIKYTDRNILWINIFLLLFVALMPFSTAMMGDYDHDVLVQLIFAFNIFFIGLMFALNWHYVTKKKDFVDLKLSEERITISRRRSLVIPIVALIAALTALVFTKHATYVYLLIPVILSLPGFKTKRENSS